MSEAEGLDKKSKKLNSNLTINFSINNENYAITVKIEFSAVLPLVRNAFTTSEILDQWLAPQPWKVKSKVMDFAEEGQSLYKMIGLNG